MAALLALLSSLSWGSADFLGGIASKRLPSLIVVGMSQAAGLVVAVVLALLTREWQAPRGYLPWAVLASLCGAAGLIAFYRALATGTMGVVAPISGMAGIVPLIAGFAAGERFTTMAAVGAVAIGIGVLLASGPELNDRAGVATVLLAMFAALMFGIALLAIAEGAEYSPIMTMVGMRTVSVLLLGSTSVVLLTRSAGYRSAARSLLWLIIVSGVLDISANLAFGYASQAGALVVVAVLGSLYPVATAVLAALFLHERLRPVQYAGVAAAVVGLSMVTLA